MAATVTGQPLMQRFRADDYGADPLNFDVLALPDGMIAVGNTRGLLLFDGNHWQLLELPGRSVARSLLLGLDQRLYVGGYDQFGLFETDATGLRVYRDLRADFGVDGEKADFGHIWEVQGDSHGVYFRTSKQLFFAAYDGRRISWPVSDGLRRMFVIDDQIYARVHGLGLCRFEGGEFRLQPGGAAFSERTLSGIYKRGDARLLVSEAGFFRADAQGIARIPGVDHGVLAEHLPNAGFQFADGSLLLGSDVGELVHFGPDLDLIGIHRLGAYTIFDMDADREGGLWVATEGELVRVAIPSPWSALTAAGGWTGSAFDTAFYDGSLWVSTTSGVYRSRQRAGVTRFEKAVETVLEAFSVLADPAGLLVGDRDGLLFHRPGQDTLRVLETDSVLSLKRSRFDASTVIAVASDEVVRLRWVESEWQILSRWPLQGISLSSVIEVAADRLWLENFRGGPQRWDYDPASGEIRQKVAFGAEHGLVIDQAFGTILHRLQDQIYAVSGDRVFRLQGERFVADPGEPFSRAPTAYDMGVAETEIGDFAFTAYQLLRRLPGTRDWQPMHLGDALTRGFSGIHADADGVLRVTTWGGLLQFDPSVAEHPVAPLEVTLSGFQLRHVDGTVRRLPLRGPEPMRLDRSDSLEFDYRMVTMDPGVEFRFRVEGVADNWSEWAPPGRPALTLRGPGPGTYRLMVEGRTRLGRVAQPLYFDFTISPAWWQTTPARILAVVAGILLLLGLVHLLVRFRYRQYVAINRRLEQRIAERTEELELANRKLAELATEDSLTGVANRRALEQGLNREWERCGELGQPLSVIMVDVDHFKQFNDRYGHLEGDQQLRRVAQALANRVRPVRELLARFGGEEFAIVLPGVGAEEAMGRAESVRLAFDNEGSATTVSVGVSTEVPSPGREPLDLLRDADEALYAAKRAGRNRVMRAAA